MNIGKRFKMYRERRGLSQKEAAELLGVKGYQLANYECNRSEPNLQTLRLMSRVYHVSLDILLAVRPITSEEVEEKIALREKEFEELKKSIETLLSEYASSKD